jgi:hypothetical protein
MDTSLTESMMTYQYYLIPSPTAIYELTSVYHILPIRYGKSKKGGLLRTTKSGGKVRGTGEQQGTREYGRRICPKGEECGDEAERDRWLGL